MIKPLCCSPGNRCPFIILVPWQNGPSPTSLKNPNSNKEPKRWMYRDTLKSEWGVYPARSSRACVTRSAELGEPFWHGGTERGDRGASLDGLCPRRHWWDQEAILVPKCACCCQTTLCPCLVYIPAGISTWRCTLASPASNPAPVAGREMQYMWLANILL